MEKKNMDFQVSKWALLHRVIAVVLAVATVLIPVELPRIAWAVEDSDDFSTVLFEDFSGDGYTAGKVYKWDETLANGSSSVVEEGVYKFSNSPSDSSMILLSAESDDWADYTVSMKGYKKYLIDENDIVSYHPGILLLSRVQYDEEHGGYVYYSAKLHSSSGIVISKRYYDEATGKFVSAAIGKSGGEVAARDGEWVDVQFTCEGNVLTATIIGKDKDGKENVASSYTYVDDGVTYGPVYETGGVGLSMEAMSTDQRSWEAIVDDFKVVAEDGTVLFSDNFCDDRYLEGITYAWQTNSANSRWVEENGIYNASSYVKSASLMSIGNADKDYGATMYNYALKADVRLNSASAVAGMIAHHDGEKYYELRLSTSKLELYLIDGTVETLIQSADVKVEANTWHSLHLCVDNNGQSVQVYLDYQQKINARNISNACTAGTFGLVAKGNASFDNLSMLPVSESDSRPFGEHLFKVGNVSELATKWTVTGGWAVSNGRLAYSGSNASVMPLKEAASYADYQVTVVGNLAQGGQLGLVGRYSADGYYKLVLDHSSAELVLSRVVGNETAVIGKVSREQLYSLGVDIYAGTDYELKLYMYKDRLQAFIDGVRVIVCTDDVIETGVAGVYGSNGASFKSMITEEAQSIPQMTFVDRNGESLAQSGTYEDPLIVPLGKLPDVTELYLKVDYGVKAPFTIPVDTLKFSDMVKDELGIHGLEVEYEGNIAVLYYESVDRTGEINELISQIEKFDLQELWIGDKEEVYGLVARYNDLSYIEKEKVSKDTVSKLTQMREAILALIYGKDALGEVVFSDSFDTAASEDLYTNDYTKISETDPGNWFVFNGQMYQYDTHEIPMEFQGFSAANMVKGKNYRITSISVDMMLLDYYGGAGLRWGYHNSDFYRVFISRRYNNASRMNLEKSGVSLANHNDIKPALKPNFNVAIYKWYNLRVIFNHDTGLIQLYFDDKLIHEEYDTDMLNMPILHEGMVGLVGYGGWVIYDNLEIRGEEVQMPTDDWVQLDTNLEPKEYQDDFNDEVAGKDPSHWLENSATDLWKVKAAGTNLIYGSTGCTGKESATWLHVFETDVDYSAKLRMTDQGAYARFGLTARVTADTSYIKAGYDAYMGKWFVETRYGYDFQPETYYADSYFTVNPDTWYDVRLKVVGKQVQLYVDGALMLTADAGKKVSVGRVGVFNDRCDVDIDDVDLQQLSGQGMVQDGVMEQYTAQAGTTIGTLFQVVDLKNGYLMLIDGNNRYVSSDNGNTWKKDSTNAIGKIESGSSISFCELHDGSILYVTGWKNVYSYDRQKRTSKWLGTITHSAETEYSQPAEHLSEVQLNDGTWRIFVALTEHNHEDLEDPIKDRATSAHVFYSDDGGATWKQSKTDSATLMNLRYFGEPHVVKVTKDVTDLSGKVLPAGTLIMYSTHNSYRTMRYIVSYDGGETWEGDYSIPYLTTAGMSSFTIEEDPYNPGTYYMAYPYNYPVRTGHGFPRLRVALMKSTDGYNWEYLCDVDRWGDVSDTDTGNTMQQVNMYLAVHKDHIFVSFSRSEQYAETTHRVQLGRLYRFDKDKLSVQEWPKEYIIPDKAIVSIEGIPQDIPYFAGYEEYLETGVLKYPVEGQLKLHYYDGTVGYVSMDDVTVHNLNTAMIGQQTIIVDYMYFRAIYTVNIVPRSVSEESPLTSLKLDSGMKMYLAYDPDMGGKLLTVTGEGAYIVVDDVRYDALAGVVKVVLPVSETAIPVIIGNSSQESYNYAIRVDENTGGYENGDGIEFVDDLYFSLNSDGQSYSVTDCYIYAGGELVIPSVYNGKPVTAIGDGAFYGKAQITRIVISEGIKQVGESAFRNCSNLVEVVIPGTVDTIGSSAFAGCSKLESVVIPEGVEILHLGTFGGCTELSCVTLPVSLKQIYSFAFNDCINLKTIIIPKGVTRLSLDSFAGSGVEKIYFCGTQEQREAMLQYGDPAIPATAVWYQHNWLDATCQVLKTCAICGDTEGAFLAHKFVNHDCVWCDARSAQITKQPSSVLVAQGATAKVSVSVSGDGLTYKWYYKNAGASKFSYTSSFTGKTYSVKMDVTRHGRQVYCIITDKYGNSVQTETVTLTMQTPLVITQQPVDVKAGEGQTAKVTFSVQGDGLTYKWYYKNPGSSIFKSTSSFTGNSYHISSMDAERSGRQVYCVITDKYGNKVTTNTVTLELADPVKITVQPADVTVGEGQTAKVTVTAVGDGLTYKWYYLEPGSDVLVLNNSVTGNTYTIGAMDAAHNGWQVRCVITDKYGYTVQSKTVTLKMADPVKITKQPTNVAVGKGETAKVTFTVTGDGLTYKWYYKNPGSSTFKSTSSFTGNTYTISAMDAERSGRQVYCVITDKYGNKVTTNTVTLRLADPVKITKQPVNVMAGKGETAKVTFTVTGDGLTYKWYYKNPGSSTFKSTSSFTGNTYTISAMDAERSGRQVYCVITDKYGNKVTTNTVTLTMANPVKITKQPTDVKAGQGETAKVTFTVTGDGLTYKWYYKNPGSSTFKSTSSFTGNSYQISSMDAARSGRQVYCVITDKYGNKVTTNTVTLSLADPVKITKQPSSVLAVDGATAKVTVSATGDGLTYKWYYKNSGSSKFSYTGTFTGSSYSVKMDATRDGRQVYCIITDKYGNSVQTETVTLEMMIPLKITKQPASVAVAKGTAAKVTFSVQGEGLTYKWYYKNPGAKKFSLTNSFKGNTYTISAMDAERSGRQVYCVITDKYGNSVQTDTVTLIMQKPLVITQQPSSVTVAKGQTATVTVSAEGDGLYYKWYYINADDEEISYYASSFKGNTYSATMTDACDGRKVYCLVYDEYGNYKKSTTVTLKMK